MPRAVAPPSDRCARCAVAVWDTPGFTKKLTAAQLAEKRAAELKNGRLAMIGIASVCAAMAIPGSVPLLKDAPMLTGSAFALPFGTF